MKERSLQSCLGIPRCDAQSFHIMPKMENWYYR